MTLFEIGTLLLQADPEIRHYDSMSKDRDYSIWEETRQLPLMGDDRHIEEAWKFYVHRFTRLEHDPVAERLFTLLDTDPRVAVSRTRDYERETGFIHHIYECEAL